MKNYSKQTKQSHAVIVSQLDDYIDMNSTFINQQDPVNTMNFSSIMKSMHNQTQQDLKQSFAGDSYCSDLNKTSFYSNKRHLSNIRGKNKKIQMSTMTNDNRSTSLIENDRIKMIKRYQSKSKATNVLMRIGFPQKKHKLQEEIRRIQQDIGGKMDEDNNQFFDLLDQTSQSFFKTLNDHDTDKMSPKQLMRDISGSADKINLRPDTRGMSLLQQPAFLYNKPRLGGEKSTKSRRTTALLSLNKSQHNSQERINEPQIDDQGATSHLRPVTTYATQKHNVKQSRNTQESSLEGKLTNVSTKFTLNNSRPQTTVLSNLLQDKRLDNNSSIMEGMSSINIDAATFATNQLNQTTITILDQIKTPEDPIQEKSQSFKKSTDAMSSFKEQRQVKVSFKQPRDAQYQAFATYLNNHDPTSLMSQINAFLNQIMEAACRNQDSFETRKNAIIDYWTSMMEFMKQHNDVNFFEIIFLTNKTIGDIYMDFRDLNYTLKVYKTVKAICEDFQRYKEKMFIYEQLGYTYRQMNDNENAVKTFKKLLQLAWQEQDILYEMTAYDNLALDYFYLGQLAKSKYYHDRIMRGKMENDKSIVKRVSTNLLVSRREQRHNAETKGEKPKAQRLPSPSAISKGGQFSKCINLLPHYTEAQACGAIDEEEEESTVVGKKRQSKSVEQKARTKGAKFLMPELQYMNKVPHYEYLKQPKKQKQVKSVTRQNPVPQDFNVYRQQQDNDYKPFDEDRFRAIVQYAVQKKETSHTTHKNRNLSHMSVHRTVGLNQINTSKVFDSIKKQIDSYRQRLVYLVAQHLAQKS